MNRQKMLGQQKNMTKETKIILAVVLVAAAGAFYWYEWRPNEIEKECAKRAVKTPSIYDVRYEVCLREKGL